MISQTDANVLIMGETGAGKEVVADTVHHHSNTGTVRWSR